jgi:hypothetical protein
MASNSRSSCRSRRRTATSSRIGNSDRNAPASASISRNATERSNRRRSPSSASELCSGRSNSQAVPPSVSICVRTAISLLRCGSEAGSSSRDGAGVYQSARNPFT